MPGRKASTARRKTAARPAPRNRALLLLAAGLMLAGAGVALAAGVGAVLRLDASRMPIPALSGFHGALAGVAIVLAGFALSNLAQRRWPLAGGWVLLAAGVAAMVLAPSVPALAPIIAVAGGLLVGWQFARRLGSVAERRR